SGSLCDSLNLVADLDDGATEEYSGSIAGFSYNVGAFSSPENWVFTAELIGDNSSLQGETCSFDFVFDGRQSGLAVGGFSDQEIISNTITAGVWEGVWVQTTQSDFEAGSPNSNIDIITSSGDAQLKSTGGFAEQLDQSNAYGESGTPYFVSGNDWGAQTFTAGMTGNLTKVSLKVKSGGAPGPFTVEIRNVSGDNPGSTLLGSASLSSISSTYAEYDFIFSPAISVTSGTQYAIVSHESAPIGGATNDRYFQSYKDGYANGKKYESSDAGSSWIAQASDDFWFKTYIEGTITYSTTGILISQPSPNFGHIIRWESLEWDETAPAGTDVTMEVSTSSDSISWSSWQLLSSISPIDLTGLAESNYIQWRATLSTTDTTVTPVLQEVRVNYSMGAATEHIVLNEFLPNPSGTDPDYGFDFGEDGSTMPQGEWVEVYNNPGSSAVDLTGWYIEDAEANRVYISETNTDTGTAIIPAGEWLVVYLNSEILNNDNDIVYLYDSFGVLVDSYSYNLADYCLLEPTGGETNDQGASGSCPTEIPGNKSYARIPDGVGDWYDPIPTPGRKNIVIIEEVAGEAVVMFSEPVEMIAEVSEMPVVVEEDSVEVVENTEEGPEGIFDTVAGAIADEILLKPMTIEITVEKPIINEEIIIEEADSLPEQEIIEEAAPAVNDEEIFVEDNSQENDGEGKEEPETPAAESVNEGEIISE
ncbi:MAG: lamin tail domain-containing protein, partial [bacterium]